MHILNDDLKKMMQENEKLQNKIKSDNILINKQKQEIERLRKNSQLNFKLIKEDNENLMKQIKKNGINLKDLKKSTNNNKPRINQIFKIKNINQNNIKTKINKKKEEYKSTSVKNDKRN